MNIVFTKKEKKNTEIFSFRAEKALIDRFKDIIGDEISFSDGVRQLILACVKAENQKENTTGLRFSENER